MKAGDNYVKEHDLSSLKTIGSGMHMALVERSAHMQGQFSTLTIIN